MLNSKVKPGNGARVSLFGAGPVRRRSLTSPKRPSVGLPNQFRYSLSMQRTDHPIRYRLSQFHPDPRRGVLQRLQDLQMVPSL